MALIEGSMAFIEGTSPSEADLHVDDTNWSAYKARTKSSSIISPIVTGDCIFRRTMDSAFAAVNTCQAPQVPDDLAGIKLVTIAMASLTQNW